MLASGELSGSLRATTAAKEFRGPTGPSSMVTMILGRGLTEAASLAHEFAERLVESAMTMLVTAVFSSLLRCARLHVNTTSKFSWSVEKKCLSLALMSSSVSYPSSSFGALHQLLAYERDVPHVCVNHRMNIPSIREHCALTSCRFSLHEVHIRMSEAARL